MADDAPFLPGLSSIAGKPVQVAFDAGRLTSDGGLLVLAEIERRLGIAERLARCLEDPRAPDRVQHGLAEMIGFRALVDRGRLRGCQRLRCLACRSGLQDGGRPTARERR
jgi:DDE family transposase